MATDVGCCRDSASNRKCLIIRDARLSIFQNFGVPGQLLGGAWIFWNKWRTFAKTAASLGVVLALFSGISEVIERWPRSPQLVVSPPLSPRTWAGFYADGSPVERVSVQLVDSGTVRESFVAEGFDVADRELDLQRIDDRLLRVTLDGNPQGTLSYSVLEQIGLRLLPRVHFRRLAGSPCPKRRMEMSVLRFDGLRKAGVLYRRGGVNRSLRAGE